MLEGVGLRRDILKQRDHLSIQDRQHKSARIHRALMELDEVRGSTSIFIYVSFRSEVQTMPIIKALINQGKTVSVPRTRVAEKRLDIVLLEDPDQDLEPGYCAIPEPKDEIAAARTISSETLDLVILPGSVFDERGGRFGYGGGYYDRLLAAIPSARRIALAFEMQVVARLPLQEHDELLDLIITEDRVIRAPARR